MNESLYRIFLYIESQLLQNLEYILYNIYCIIHIRNYVKINNIYLYMHIVWRWMPVFIDILA